MERQHLIERKRISKIKKKLYNEEKKDIKRRYDERETEA